MNSVHQWWVGMVGGDGGWVWGMGLDFRAFRKRRPTCILVLINSSGEMTETAAKRATAPETKGTPSKCKFEEKEEDEEGDAEDDETASPR